MAFPAVKFNFALILHGPVGEGHETADGLFPLRSRWEAGGTRINNVSLWEIIPNAIEYAFGASEGYQANELPFLAIR